MKMTSALQCLVKPVVRARLAPCCDDSSSDRLERWESHRRSAADLARRVHAVTSLTVSAKQAPVNRPVHVPRRRASSSPQYCAIYSRKDSAHRALSWTTASLSVCSRRRYALRGTAAKWALAVAAHPLENSKTAAHRSQCRFERALRHRPAHLPQCGGLFTSCVEVAPPPRAARGDHGNARGLRADQLCGPGLSANTGTRRGIASAHRTAETRRWKPKLRLEQAGATACARPPSSRTPCCAGRAVAQPGFDARGHRDDVDVACRANTRTAASIRMSAPWRPSRRRTRRARLRNGRSGRSQR